MFSQYQTGSFFDEMFHQHSGNVFEHYSVLKKRFEALDTDELKAKQRMVDEGFLEEGITFTVYGDEKGTERIFPFDLIPRIIPQKEWTQIEEGLTQRIIALNLFLNDIYHEAQIVRDGIVPQEVLHVATHFRPEMKGLKVSKDSYIQICGTDLIRDDSGRYLVL